jgi:hypothetical protein
VFAEDEDDQEGRNEDETEGHVGKEHNLTRAARDEDKTTGMD